MMAGPNDYELGYDEGYQDGTAINHDLAGLVTERDDWKARAEKAEAERDEMAELAKFNKDQAERFKARAEKAEAALRTISTSYFRDDQYQDYARAALKEQGQ